MSDETTNQLNDARSFEERLFARFDALETMVRAIDARVQNVNERVGRPEASSYDMEPIWERALAEILEVKQAVGNLGRKFDVLHSDLLQTRADLRNVENGVDDLERRAS